MFVVTLELTKRAVAVVRRLERAAVSAVALALPASLAEEGLKKLHRAISAGFVPVSRRAFVISAAFVAPTTDKSNFPPRSSTQ